MNWFKFTGHLLPWWYFKHNDINGCVYNFPKDASHAQSKHVLAIFIHDMTPAHTPHSFHDKHDGDVLRSRPLASRGPTRSGPRDQKSAGPRAGRNGDQRNLNSWNLLLCTVDELVFVGSLKARLHSFVIPQLLRMIKELLGRRENTSERCTQNDWKYWKIRAGIRMEGPRAPAS